MKKLLILLAVLWIPCGYLNYGLLLGGFTHQFPYMPNMTEAVVGAIIGPFGTPAALIVPGPPYHFLLKPKTVEERWQIFHEQLPSLSREYFDEKYN